MTETSNTLPIMAKIKLLDGGKMPERKTAGAACYDCYAAENVVIHPRGTIIVRLGFAIEVPENYYLEIRPRSGLSSKGILAHIGTVDSDYRGEIGAIITNLKNDDKPLEIKAGDRICQMMIKKIISGEIIEAAELSETERGTGGFGSTGK